MKTIANVLALAALAAAAPSSAPQDPAVEVKLEMQGNSNVKAVVTNTGSEDVKIFKYSGLLGHGPVQKVQVSSEGQALPFKGAYVELNHANLNDADFETIPSGQSTSTVFDVAELFDLSGGGSFAIKPTGSLRYAKGGNTSDLGSIAYEAHEIVAQIDGNHASSVRRDLHALYDRAVVSEDCPRDKYEAAHRSIKNVHDMALAAADAARNGPARLLDQVFRRSDDEAREIVAGAYDNMVRYYASDSEAIPTIHCADVGNLCSPRTTAYVLPEKSVVVFCDGWYDEYPEHNPNCARHDQSVIAVHEASHLDEVKGTIDNEGDTDNLNHADSYGVFAHLVQNGC